MDQTTNLSLPFIMPSQAQKQITHNQALQILDTVVQLAVVDRDLAIPPGSPADAARYIVASGGSAAWGGKDGMVAAWQNGAWSFLSPRTGWLAWVEDEACLVYYTGSGWAQLETAIAVLQNLAALGIGTAADGSNPFSAKLNSALWAAKYVAEGGSGDLRYTLNKEHDGNVLSLLMQSGWSGRAEIGLIGNDDFAIKLSPDGSTWVTGLAISGADGTAQFVAGNAAAPALKIGDGKTGIYGPGGALRFSIEGTQRAALNSYGFVIGGGADPTAALPFAMISAASDPGVGVATLQLHGETSVGALLYRNSADASGPNVSLRKGRGTIAAPALPASGDTLGTIRWQADGAGSPTATAALSVSVTEPTPSAAKMAMRAILAMPPLGSATATEVLRVEADFGLSMFGTNPVIDQNRHHVLRTYMIATLPPAAGAAHLIYVADGAANKHLAVSDGTNWRWPDGTVVA